MEFTVKFTLLLRQKKLYVNAVSFNLSYGDELEGDEGVLYEGFYEGDDERKVG